MQQNEDFDDDDNGYGNARGFAAANNGVPGAGLRMGPGGGGGMKTAQQPIAGSNLLAKK
jgi:hypothetical protein